MSKTIDTVIDNLVTDVKDLLDFGADLAKDAADRVIDLVNPPEKTDAGAKTESTPQEKIANLSEMYSIDYDDETLACSYPGCGLHHWDDGAPLCDYTVVTCPGEEGYAEVTQIFCMEHSQWVVDELLKLGFKSHNHHGSYPVRIREYGPELVQPDGYRQ